MKKKPVNKTESNNAISPEQREFMHMAFDAFMSKSAEHATWKTRFIAQLIETDVDARTIARLNRALDPQSRWLSKSPTPRS